MTSLSKNNEPLVTDPSLGIDRLTELIDLILQYDLPTHPATSQIPRKCFSFMESEIRDDPGRFLYNFPQGDNNGLELNEDMVCREATIGIYWSRFAIGRDPRWFSCLAQYCFEVYKILEAKRKIKDLVDTAGLETVAESERVSPKLWYQCENPEADPPHRFCFEHPQRMLIETGARYFLWLAAAHQPAYFGYPEGFRNDLEMARFWIASRDCKKDPELVTISYADEPIIAIGDALNFACENVDYDAYRAEQSPEQLIDGPQEGGKDFRIGGKIVRLTSMQYDVMEVIWISHQKSADVTECSAVREKRDRRGRGKIHEGDRVAARSWASSYLPKLNKKLAEIDYFVSQDIIDFELTLVDKDKKRYCK